MDNCTKYKDFLPQVTPFPIQSLSDYDSMCFFLGPMKNYE